MTARVAAPAAHVAFPEVPPMHDCATSERPADRPAGCRVCGLPTEPEREFDDLLRVVVEWSGATAGTVRLAGSAGWWVKSSVGVVPIRRTGSARRRRVARFDIRDADGVVIGELALDGAEPATGMAELLAGRFARLVADRRPAAHRTPAATWYVVASPVGVLSAVSPHVVELLGRSPDETLGHNVLEFIHPGDHERAFDSLTRAATFPGEQYPIDLRLLHTDGSPVVLEVTAVVPLGSGDHGVVFEIRETAERDGADTAVAAQARLLAMIGRGGRRRGHVPGEGSGPQPDRDLRHRDARPRDGPPRAGAVDARLDRPW